MVNYGKFTKAIDAYGRNVLFTPTGKNEVNLGSTREGSALLLTPDIFSRVVNRYGSTPHKRETIGVPDCRVEAIFHQNDFDKLELFLGTGKMTIGGTAVASDTLSDAITDTDTIIPLTTFATGFEDLPANGTGYVIEIENEYILVPAVDETAKELGTTDCPVVRGYNNTTAVSHVSTTAVDRLTVVIDYDPRPQPLMSGKLILRKLGLTSADDSDIILWNAQISPNLSTALRIGEDAGYAVIFHGNLEENCAGQIRLIRFGKADIEPEKSYFPQ